MLITYAGRKTGKPYTFPIGYFVWDKDELMSFSSARWWTNLRDGTPVTLLRKGCRPTTAHRLAPRPRADSGRLARRATGHRAYPF